MKSAPDFYAFLKSHYIRWMILHIESIKCFKIYFSAAAIFSQFGLKQINQDWTTATGSERRHRLFQSRSATMLTASSISLKLTCSKNCKKPVEYREAEFYKTPWRLLRGICRQRRMPLFQLESGHILFFLIYEMKFGGMFSQINRSKMYSNYQSLSRPVKPCSGPDSRFAVR